MQEFFSARFDSVLQKHIKLLKTYLLVIGDSSISMQQFHCLPMQLHAHCMGEIDSNEKCLQNFALSKLHEHASYFFPKR